MENFENDLIFGSNVTIYENMINTSVPHYVSVREVLNWIKLGRWSKIVEGVRESTNKKTDLPCVTWVCLLYTSDAADE